MECPVCLVTRYDLILGTVWLHAICEGCQPQAVQAYGQCNIVLTHIHVFVSLRQKPPNSLKNR